MDTISIEISAKPEVALSPDVHNVIVVNNALPQQITDDTHYSEPAIDSMFLVSFRDAVWMAVREMSSTLGDEQTDRFSDVSYYRQALRSDRKWLATVPLDSITFGDFFDAGFDAVVSVDMLIFRIEDLGKGGRNARFPRRLGKMTVAAALYASVYTAGKPDSAISLVLTDTIALVPNTIEKVRVSEFIEAMNYGLRLLTKSVARKAADKLLPQWIPTDRVYYSSLKMIDAEQLVLTGNWKEAETFWFNAYTNTDNTIQKARLALNISLACEMQDKMNSALFWAEKSAAIYRKAKLSERKRLRREEEIANLLISSLKYRVENF
jgi:hypothetical protein